MLTFEYRECTLHQIMVRSRAGGPRRSSGGVAKEGAGRTLKLAKAAARAVLSAAGFASGSAAEAANAREVLTTAAAAAQAYGPPDDGVESDDDDGEASGGEEGGAVAEGGSAEEAAAQDLAALDLSQGADDAQSSEPSDAARSVAASRASIKDM